MSRTAQHYQKGFSLLELAIVIGIIALVLAFGINIGSNVMKGSERITTQERLATIQKALDQFAELHGYLPCPARRDYAPSAGFYFGREERDTSNSGQCWISGGGSIQANGVLYGAVPVRTLGLPDAYIADAWSGKFTYAVSNNMVGSIGSFHTENGNLRVVYNDGSSSYPQANQRDAADYGVAYAVDRKSVV